MSLSHRKRPGIIVLVAALATAALLAAPGKGVCDLPPLECVLLLRDARIAEAAGNLEEARRLLEQAADSYPEDLIPILELWGFHRRVNSRPAERERLRKLLSRRFADPSKRLPSGSLEFLVNDGSLEEPELTALLQRVEGRLEDQGKDPVLLEAAFVLQQRLERPEAARKTLDQLIEAHPSERFEWYALELDLHLERWEKALAFLRRQVEKGDAAPLWHMQYLRVLSELGMDEELRREVDAILESPEDDLSRGLLSRLKELAWTFYGQDELELAETLWRKVSAANPEDEQAAEVLHYLFGAEAPVPSFAAEAATEKGPHDWLEEGTSLLVAGDAAAAFELLAKAAPEFPDREQAWFNLGLAALWLERWSAVEEAFARAVQLNPNRAESHYNRGLALHHLQRCGEAVESLRSALALDPERRAAYYYLSFCHASLGNHEEAEKAIRAYRSRQP